MRLLLALWIALPVLLVGCSTRSISDSGYNARGSHYGGGSGLYRGELSEFDVLGVTARETVTEAEIQAAFVENPTRPMMRKGDSILLIQSGALIPDSEMIDLLEKDFSVSVFTGVPEKEKEETASYAKSLRLAAAKSGIGTIVVYWGALESGSGNLATKSVSWIPIVGYAVPDETQHMRIRLKVAVVDVRSGQWEIFSPESREDRIISARVNRGNADQNQVALLKTAAYQLAAEGVTTRYLR